jgi:glycosyltransferase involved in cell wall biosynthesis
MVVAGSIQTNALGYPERDRQVAEESGPYHFLRPGFKRGANAQSLCRSNALLEHVLWRGLDFPMMEAGVMGLHLIAPEHSAYTAYLDRSVAQMIPSRRVPADFNGGEGLGKLFQGSDWWKPDDEAAVDCVRQAIRTAGEKLPTARARIAKEFTWERSANRIVEIMEELHERHGKKF